MLKKQSGMTLVEVLATLILTSLVIMLIWTTVVTSMKYNLAETKKLRMQQEINYIITDIQRIHREYGCYQIKEVSDGVWRTVDCSTGRTISNYSSTDFSFKLVDQPDEIYTKRQEALKAGKTYIDSYTLTVEAHKSNNKNTPSVSVTTKISRYEEEAKQGGK